MHESMTLSQIAQGYREAAVPLRARLRQLRRELKTAEDPEEIFHLKRRIAELTPMLTECNALAALCEHYYERGYYRDEKYTMQNITGPAVTQRGAAATHSQRYGA